MIRQTISGLIQSRLIRWLLTTGFFLLLLLALFRVAFHLVFVMAGENNVAASFWMGFRYDARIVCVFLMIILLLGMLPFFKPFSNKISRVVLFFLLYFFIGMIIIFYTVDFAHFAYLRQRLNASVLNYTEDASISAGMVWQSYPVIKILLGWALAFTGIYFVCRFIYRISSRVPQITTKRNFIVSYAVCFLVFGLAIFGRVSQFPLRWSDAYRLNSDYKASLALNPFQSFFSSLKFRNSGYDIQKAKKYYSLLAGELGVPTPDTATLHFDRPAIVNDSVISTRPNVVLVICESFCSYKSSMWGNPLNTTPYFNELSKKGVFFKNCFSPAYGTARGIWAIVTGTPDVSELRTASRNPKLVDQQTILNDISGYNKFYFLGGSASWANIRGVLTDNIKDLHLYEKGDYKSRSVNVWGISDKDLFLEANDIFRQQADPFFAIIQTADNHRPYTIPEEDKPFIQLRNLPKDTLEKYGFWSNEELNAYAYMDYTYKVFLETSSKEKYFNNTIFVFVGDHGLSGNAGNMFPKVWTEQALTSHHVPLLFYAPSLLPPRVIEKKVSQIDIMPSITYLAGLQVNNTTLGRNVFSNTFITDNNDISNHTFILQPDNKLIGLLAGNYYYNYDLRTNKGHVFSLLNNDLLKPGEPDSIFLTKMQDLTLGYYEISRYMLFNNKKKR